MRASSVAAVPDASPQGAGASMFLLFSRKWIRVLGFRLPVWAHVGVLLVDRAAARATFYDVVSGRARGGKAES